MPTLAARPVVGGRVGGRTFLSLLPQLFLFPLLLVTVGVLVYLLFVASAQDNRSISELLSDIESGGGHSRKQDAWALSQKVSELDRGGESRYMTEDETRQLLKIIQSSLSQARDDDEVVAVLVYALGRAGQRGIAVPVLRGFLEDDATPIDVLNKAIVGLSLSRDARAVVPLLDEIDKRSAPEEWETRLVAIHAVTHILSGGKRLSKESLAGDSKVKMTIARLEPMVGNRRKEVSWNTSIYLAKYFRSATGEPVLRQLVSWDFLDEQRGDYNRELSPEQKELWMKLSLDALFELRGEGVRDLLEQKRDDRNLAVRNVALTCLKELDAEA